MDTKKQIETPEDFLMAMNSVKSAMSILSLFDWRSLSERIALFESVGPVLNPSMFQDMMKDPQWEQKKQLFKAAADFTSTLDDIRSQLGHDD